ncbi:MAG: DUF2283 domain-containing protein [Nanoarchaeota archaeon]|nr:DUF2283 domain-containing protein [Nanoarchaeota archaeon]
MKIDFDKEADAIYITLKEGEFHENKKINDFMIIDLDSEGNVLGIELLEVSKHLPPESLAKVELNNLIAA